MSIDAPTPAVRLEDVLVTDRLDARPVPPPDHAAENAALHRLAREIAGDPGAALQALVDAAIALRDAGSAGVSLLDAEADVFRWVAMAGAYASFVGGTTPGKFSPCGTTLDKGSPQLYHYPERLFTYFQQAKPVIVEGLVIPFRSGDTLGTIWIVSHDEGRQFTAEDVRVMSSLGDFTSAALAAQAGRRQAERARALLAEKSEREKVTEGLRRVRGVLRRRVRERTKKLAKANRKLRAEMAERERAEAAMARDAMLLSNVRDSVIVTDLNGIVTFWNEGATKLFGFEASEMLGRPYAERLPEPTRAEVADWIGKIAAGEAEFEGEWLDYRRDGSRVWIQASTRLVRDAAGHPLGIMGVAHDISERKRAEDETKKAKDAAEAANRAKDRFLAVLSHELRTPLSPVVMSLAAMQIDPELPLRLREEVAMVRRNIDLETKLIDDLLDLSRVTSGKLRLQLQPTHVHDLLRHVLHNSLNDTSGKRLTVRRDFDAPLDSVMADSARLQQVFWNLMRNAAKFTPEGGSIRVRTRNDGGGRLVIDFEDSGIGIPPDALPRIFGAFEQADTSITRRFGGLGLGLSISKAVMDMLGGTIRAHSDGPGTGSTFIVEMPTVAQVATEVRSDVGGGDRAAANLRVLLVEDHHDTARTLARLLSRCGYAVKTANDAASALRLAAQERFDVVVSDIGLPDATGHELMRQLKAAYGLKGIALSGYGMEEDLQNSRTAGFDDHVVKPVDLAQLQGVIQRVARKS